MIISEETIKQIQNEGYTIWTEKSYDPNYDGMETIVDLEHSSWFKLNKWNNGSFFSKTFNAPKKKEITFEWIMNKLEPNNDYTNLRKYLLKVFKERGISVYCASYGIGVDNLFGRNQNTKNEIEIKLNELGLKYKTEYSHAGWTYRYKISKCKENMKILKNL